MQSNCKGTQGYGVVAIMLLAVHACCFLSHQLQYFQRYYEFWYCSYRAFSGFLVFLIHAVAVCPKRRHSAPVHSAQEHAQVRIIRYEATHVEIIVY